MTDLTRLWNFDDPAGSERRLREAADVAEGTDRLVLLTQVARALGLQGRYEDANAVLDQLATHDPEVATRVSLERGRLLRSAGEPDAAIPHFEAAERTAAESGAVGLQVDALHMLALVVDPADRVATGRRALEIATASSDPVVRDWDASLLNNLGMVHAEAGRFEDALAAFEQALAARQRIGDPEQTRIARWMVAWALRNLGRSDEALAIQRSIKADLDAAGRSDPHVDEELALLGD